MPVISLFFYTVFFQQPHVAQPIFEDVTAASGLNFTHVSGKTGHYYLPEIVGSGAALIDYDRDGDLDVYVVQSGQLVGEKVKGQTDRLFRNDGKGGGKPLKALHFTDVTASSGIEAAGYGNGVAVGDIDNDGDDDLYVVNLGANQMWRNQGDGTFQDVTAASGTGDPGWGTSATFFDFDLDGWLDLYVCNYLIFSVETSPKCYASNSAPEYCSPSAMKPAPDRLYRNKGNGVFEDAGHLLKGLKSPGAGLGVVTGDFNGDQLVDIYVANDGLPNELWLGQAEGGFHEDALFSGVALNEAGNPEASMGVAAGDFDNDGDEDIFVTHLAEETNTLYVNDGRGLFEDRTAKLKLATESLTLTGFGTFWVDLDNDGWLDLVVVNGAVKMHAMTEARPVPQTLQQHDQIFYNLQGKQFVEISAKGGNAFQSGGVGRGLAVGDLDNDGDSDLVVVNNDGPLRLLENQWGHRQEWLGLSLVDGKSGRHLLGTKVQLVPEKGPSQIRTVNTGGSYCSANDARLLFGLGQQKKVGRLILTWPDGSRQELTDLKVGRYHEIKK